MNVVPESARLLQMTRTRIPRVDTRDLPEAPLFDDLFAEPPTGSNSFSLKLSNITKSNLILVYTLLQL